MGRAGLVGCRVLVSGRERDHRRKAGKGSLVVGVGSLVGRRVRRRVVGEGEECWRNLGREDIVVLPDLVRSWVEEGIAVGRSPAGRMAVEGDNHLGCRRSSRCLTL